MGRISLTEALDLLREEMLDEYDFMAGPGMIDRPEFAGDQNYNTLKGAPRNFASRTDKGHEWPYEDDGEMDFGIPSWSSGNWAWGRGDRPGTDVSGGPPTQRYGDTWEGGPDEVEEGADWEELQRHGSEKMRNVWRDTPDGKQWTEMNNEAMGQPTQTGPVAPMDGPQHDTGKDADPVEDEHGRPIVPKDQFQQTYTKDMSGPAGQWGGPETIPGQSRGWAESPQEGDHPDDVWRVPEEKREMRLREFFDPRPVPTQQNENPEPEHMEDQSDEELSDKIEPEEMDGFDGGACDEPDSFSDRLGRTSIFLLPNVGQESEFVASPDKMGAARGTYGMHMDSDQHRDLVDKSTAWDLLQHVIAAMARSESSEDPGEEG